MKNKKTKHLINYTKISLLASLTGIVACSSPQEQSNDLVQLKAQYTQMEEQYSALRTQMQQTDTRIKQLEGTENLIPITSRAVQIGTYKHYIDLKGNVESDENIQVFPEATARIISVKVTEGQKVSKGEIIAVLDSRVMEENLRELKGSLGLASTMFDRQQRLWDQKIGSEAQYLEAKNNKESLQSKVAALEEQIHLHKVRAPFSGTIDQVYVKQGEMAVGAAPIVRLVNLDKMYVQAEVSETNIKNVKIGSTVMINDSLTASVNSVAQYINPSNRTFRVKIKLPASSPFNPNELVKVAILDLDVTDATMIPTSLIQQMSNGENYIYTLKDIQGSRAIVQRIIVDVKSSYNNTAYVIAPLSSQTMIVDKGSRNVRDGQAVLVK